jgi:hypothetical protein
MHNRFGLVTILTLVVAELGVHERCFTAGAAVLTLLDPEQWQGYTSFLHFPMNLLDIRWFVSSRKRLLREVKIRQTVFG